MAPGVRAQVPPPGTQSLTGGSRRNVSSALPGDGALPFIWRVLERMQPDDIRATCRDLTQGEITELARIAGVPRVVISRDSSSARVLRRRARRSTKTAKLIV